MQSGTGQANEPHTAARPGDLRVIGASALGTLFEWYDFFLYGALASTFAAHFFSAVNETTAFLLALATFAVGFIVRPVGAILFAGAAIGRISILEAMKSIWPFYIAAITVLLLVTFVPAISLTLPTLFRH